MKYLIVKGYLGFGDRLESLKMGVKYALDHNLQIYVDWRDPAWSHGSEDFYTYFKLVNIPVLKSLEDLPTDSTFFPSFWKDCLHEQVTADFIKQHKDDGIDIGLLDKTHDADVIVFSSCGWRTLYPDSLFFANVFRVSDNRILSAIQTHKSRYPIEKAWGIHIRGTDHVHRRKRMFCIQGIVCHVTTMGGINTPHIVVVSDDKEMSQIWKNYYPQSYLVSDLSFQTSIAGNHNLLKDGLLGKTKDILNVEMLTDFFILASVNTIYPTVKSSRFYHEAYRLHPHVSKILSST